MTSRQKVSTKLSLLTVVALLVSAVSGLLFVSPAKAAALTSMSDTMSRLQISIADVTHTMVFTPTTAINQDDGVQVTVPTAFGDASLDVADYSITQAAGGTACAAWTEVAYVPANDVIQFECDTVGAAGTGAITVAITVDLDNPATVSSYEFGVATYDLGADTAFGGGDDVVEDTGSMEVPIVDDDTVNVTGYIDTFISFDIDTTTDLVAATNTQCDAAGGVNPCDSYGGSTDNAGYVVDLGEMTTATVNNAGDAVQHQDGGNGAINSIAFDLSTNAVGGAVVTVVSLNEALLGPGANSIPSVVGGPTAITAGAGLYGLRELDSAATTGAFTVGAAYDGAAGSFGTVVDGGTPLQILNTGAAPIDVGRSVFELGASPNAADGTGTYVDQLTFVATATF